MPTGHCPVVLMQVVMTTMMKKMTMRTMKVIGRSGVEMTTTMATTATSMIMTMRVMEVIGRCGDEMLTMMMMTTTTSMTITMTTMMKVIGMCGVERVIQVGLMNGSASFYCSRGREVADDARHDDDDHGDHH